MSSKPEPDGQEFDEPHDSVDSEDPPWISICCTLPPPLSFHAPCPSPGGVGGPSLGEPQKGPSHRPRVLSKAFPWKAVSMFKNSRSNGVGRRNSTPSESRSKFHYIGSPLSAHMIFILLHYLLSFVTVTSSAHQRVLCCVVSSSATISVPHSVRVRRYYGLPGGGGGLSLGDRPPGGGGGPSSLGWGRTRGGKGTSIILPCTIHIQFGLQETHAIPISWLFSGCQCCCVMRRRCVRCVAIGAPPPQFVVSARNIIVLNALAVTFAAMTLFIRDTKSHSR